MTARHVIDQQRIAWCLGRHSTTIDSLDEEGLNACYTPDGAVAYGFFDGAARQLARMLMTSKAGKPRTVHRTSNIWSEVRGDKAWAESYVVACNTGEESGQIAKRLIVGRYLDRLLRADDGWRIAHRTYVLDLNVNRLGDADESDPFPLSTGVSGSTLAVGPRTMTAEDATARVELRALAHSWCRAVDRGDAILLAATGIDACQMVPSGTSRVVHAVSNLRFAVDGDTASGTSRFTQFVTHDGPDGPRERISVGRFEDRFIRRDGAWKFADRRSMVEQNYEGPSTCLLGAGMYASLKNVGTRDTNDPVHAFWLGDF